MLNLKNRRYIANRLCPDIRGQDQLQELDLLVEKELGYQKRFLSARCMFQRPQIATGRFSG